MVKNTLNGSSIASKVLTLTPVHIITSPAALRLFLKAALRHYAFDGHSVNGNPPVSIPVELFGPGSHGFLQQDKTAPHHRHSRRLLLSYLCLLILQLRSQRSEVSHRIQYFQLFPRFRFSIMRHLPGRWKILFYAIRSTAGGANC